MRQVLFAGFLIAGLVVTASPNFARTRAPAPAVAGDQIQDRYCLFGGRTWGWFGPCQFSTYEQCMWTAYGTGAGCRLNPSYAFEQWGHRPGY